MPLVEILVPSHPATNVPAFLAKHWKMVDNPDTDDLISWTEQGSSFLIKTQSQFAKTLLPYYYKHSNMASFVRQLNMYGFHKVLSIQSGGLRGEARDQIEFAHSFFLRGQEALLDKIKRKSSGGGKAAGGAGTIKQEQPIIITKVEPADAGEHELVGELLSQLKEGQEEVDGKLDSMRSENEALWGEVLSLRQKHNQQQKIVNKLIQFLVALVQPRLGQGIKRKYKQHGFPTQQTKLAIAEGSTRSAKEAKVDPEAGPIIQEIAEDIRSCHLAPQPESQYRMVDPASVSPSLLQIKAEADLRSHHNNILNTPPKEEFDVDLSSMQAELDGLKELLGGGVTLELDSSLVSSLLPDPATVPCPALPGLFDSDTLLDIAQDDDPNPATDLNRSLTWNSKGDILDLATDGIGLDQENLHTDNTMESNENLDPLAKMFFDYKAT